MSPTLIAIVLAASGMLAGAVVFALVRRGRKAPHSARPAWMGVDAVQAEADLRSGLDQARWRGGAPPMDSDDGLEEMARHHAHALARLGRDSAVDDQGRDVDGRRVLLYPELLGRLAEHRCVVQADDADIATDTLVAELVAPWSDATWTAGAVGVATHGRHVAACAVLARRVLILQRAPWHEDGDHPGRARITQRSLVLEGVLAEAAASIPRFFVQGPGSKKRPIASTAMGTGRVRLTLDLETVGDHALLADEEIIFIFRFDDPVSQ